MSATGAYFRLLRAGWIMVREGVIAAIPGEQFDGFARFAWRVGSALAKDETKHRDRAGSLAAAVERLGPSYVKLGQFLATRPDVVGHDIADDLAGLQDRMETFPTADAKAVIRASLGRTADELYSGFGEPVAAASIAQVHFAETTSDGVSKKVAVKVIRPGVRRRFFNDLESYFLASRLQERFIPAARRLKPVEVTETLARITKLEMDLRLEAAALSELAENTANDRGFRVPSVDWERTGRDVLTLEWVDGTKFSDINGLKAAGHDLKRLARDLVRNFLRHTLRDGFFHADMHPGNLFVNAEGDIVAVDLGIMGRIGRKERRFLAEILHGFITRSYSRVAEAHIEAGYVPSKHGTAAFSQAIRAIGEPIQGQSADTISMARLLTLLFEVTELFDMATRPELLLLQKTMVVVEGVARTLDPEFNMWKAADPVVSDWVIGNLGPRAALQDAGDGVKALASLVRQAPEFKQRAERLSEEIGAMAEHGLRFDDETAIKIGKAEARHTRSGRIALWIIALTLVWVAWQIG